MPFIYKITNNLNGKCYIGKTNTSVAQRFKEHVSDSKLPRCSNRPLYRAFNKYGIENFQLEVIEETDTPEDREIIWIDYYNSYHFGYNATRGGDGKSYVDYNIIMKLHNNGLSVCDIIKQTKHDRKTISNYFKTNNIVPNPHNKAKIKTMKKVMCVETGVEFESISECVRYFINLFNLKSSNKGGYSGHVGQCCKGRRKTVFGYTWRFV